MTHFGLYFHKKWHNLLKNEEKRAIFPEIGRFLVDHTSSNFLQKSMIFMDFMEI